MADVVQEPNRNLKIYAKLSAIQAEIERMEKDGTNNFQNYKYLSETQITFQMKTLLDKHKVLFHYNSSIKRVYPPLETGMKQILTDVEINYRFVDAESGEYVSGFAAGQGADNGDKGVYKAITGAIKYIYMKTFNIPTGDDPERDGPRQKKMFTKKPTGHPSDEGFSPGGPITDLED